MPGPIRAQYSGAMSQTILVLTEEALTRADLTTLRAVQGEEPAEFVVLVPEDRDESVVAGFFRHLSLLEVGEAFRSLSGEDPREEKATAEAALQESLRVLSADGLHGRGRTATGSPVDALVQEAADCAATQAVVITRPDALADTFHTDWASKAQDKLGIAVLHVYSDSGFIGDS